MSDQELVHSIVTAVANCSLYSRAHPVVHDYTKKAVRLLDELYVDGRCSLVLLDGTLVINDRPFTGAPDLAAALVRRFGQKKAGKAVFSKGVTIPELLDWVAKMAGQGPVASTAHIAMGSVEVRGTKELGEPDEQYERSLRLFSDIYSAARDGRMDIAGLQRIVTDFLDLLDRERNILRIIGPFRSHSNYTLVHITNVTILTMFLARALGIEGGILRDIGVSALMHDVGKLFIPTVVIDKPGALDPAEWERMKQHTVHGALFLSRQRQVPPITAIVAYEHHMRYDGSGYPVPRPAGKRQHLVSQMVAVGDTFEAMRMDRPYKRSLDVPQIAGVLKAGSGTSFNPQLVQTFLAAFGESMSAGAA